MRPKPHGMDWAVQLPLQLSSRSGSLFTRCFNRDRTAEGVPCGDWVPYMGIGPDRPAVHGPLATPAGPVHQAWLVEGTGGCKADCAVQSVRGPMGPHLHARARPHRPTVPGEVPIPKPENRTPHVRNGFRSELCMQHSPIHFCIWNALPCVGLWSHTWSLQDVVTCQ